jgi:hypothetical protein
MSTYQNIKGLKVPSIASDPSPATEGQLWYNTASNTLKYTSQAGSWAAGNDLNTRRVDSRAAGTTNALLIDCGGLTPASGPTDPGSVHTESYNGTSFTTVNDMNQPSGYNGFGGTSTAAVSMCCGASPPSGGNTNMDLSETWDGTCWTNANDMNTGRQQMAGFGAVYTAAIATQGNSGGPMGGWTESWDGTCWTNVNDGVVDTKNLCAQGTQAAGMAIGGFPFLNTTQDWDGTCWTAGTSYNSGRHAMGGTTQGTPSSALIFGGQGPAPLTLTESYNGTAWTEVNDMATACYGMGSGGTGNSNAIAIDANPSPSAGTEIWTFAAATKTVTTS